MYVKLLKKLKKEPEDSVKHDLKASSRQMQLENNFWIDSSTQDVAISPSSEQIDEYLLQDEESKKNAKFKPNFGKFETIFNSLLLILLTIFTGIVALVMSPAIIFALAKSRYRKLTNKNH